MSIFASRTLKTIEVPHDPPHTVTIQALPGRTFHRARQTSILDSAQTFRQMGGAAFQQDLKAIAADTKKPVEAIVEEAQADPTGQYDVAVVLRGGIKAWTYDLPVSEAAIDDLDEITSAFLHAEILRLTKPSLFQTKAEQEAARKNA